MATLSTDSITGQNRIIPVGAPDNSQLYTNALTSNGLDATTQIAQAQEASRLATAQSAKNVSDIGAVQGLYDSLSGREAFTQQQRQDKGVDVQQSNLTNINKQILGLNAQVQNIPMQTQADQLGRMGTQAGVQAIETGRLREAAMQSNILSAQQAAAMGDLALANQKVQQAVDLQYKDKEDMITSKLRQLELNTKLYDTLSSQEKKQWDGIKLGAEQERFKVAEQKEVAKGIQNIGMALSKYGVSARIITEVLSSNNVNEAIIRAGSNLQDPAAKLEIQKIGTEIALNKTKMATESYQLTLLRQYGGLTPTQYRAELAAETKTIAEATTKQEQARLQGNALNTKILLLDAVIGSNAIDSVVGPSVASRAATGFGGFVGRFGAGFVAGGAVGAGVGAFAGGVGALPGSVVGGLVGGTTLALQGSKDYFTGSADKLVGQTEQFISKEFIQNLIDVKAQGAVFGALQKAEQDALTASATFIGQRRITSGSGENKTVVGYDMSEADFKRELGTIQELTRKAYERSTGNSHTPEEKAILDANFPTTESTPSIYFN